MTGFDKWLEEQLQDPRFRAMYEKSQEEIARLVALRAEPPEQDDR